MNITPEFVRAILSTYRVRPNVHNPESAAWSADCPHCKSEADWWSGKTTSGLKYRMACRQCGEIEWVADR